MSATRRLLGAVAAACAACTGGRVSAAGARDDAAVQGAALRLLFRERERAGQVVVWSDSAEPGPVFAALGVRGAVPNDADARALATSAGLPVARVRAADLERLFAEHPDGWAAFYAGRPGAAGLVELGPVTRTGDSAAVTVGRACGEQCRNAWRVTLVAEPGGGRWRASAVHPLRVPP